MSDILIKGMEMPKSCESCKFCWRGVSTGTFCKINGKMISEGYASFDSRDINCPLVELPEHGDLIDRSKLSTTAITDYNLEGHLVVEIEDIENAPTILEASE